MDPGIRVQELNAWFGGTQALHDIGLEIPSRQVTATRRAVRLRRASMTPGSALIPLSTSEIQAAQWAPGTMSSMRLRPGPAGVIHGFASSPRSGGVWLVSAAIGAGQQVMGSAANGDMNAIDAPYHFA